MDLRQRGVSLYKANSDVKVRAIIMSVCWVVINFSYPTAAARQADAERSIQRRPFTVNDLFRLRELGKFAGGPYAYSPKGSALAVTLLRPVNSDPSQLWKELQSGDLQSNARGDVWVQLVIGKPLRNITHGGTDRSGWFSPQWAPDGIHLAMLSTRGGVLRLWAWNRLTRRLRPVSRTQVVFKPGQPGAFPEQPYVWLNAHDILFAAKPRETRTDMLREYGYMLSDTPALATAAWRRYLSGTKSTASVIDDVTEPALLGGVNLVVVDLAGHEKVIARNVDTELWQASPNGNAVAFTRNPRIVPGANGNVLNYGDKWQTEVVVIERQKSIIVGKKIGHVLPMSLRWSPNGGNLAYLGYATASQKRPMLYILNVHTHRVRAIPLKGIDPAPRARFANPFLGHTLPGLVWASAGHVLVRGEKIPPDVSNALTVNARQDWWLLSTNSTNGMSVCLTCGLRHVPPQFWPELGRIRFIGLSNGKLWQLDISSRSTSDLTERLHLPVNTVDFPPVSFGPINFLFLNRWRIRRVFNRAVFVANDRGEKRTYVMDLRTGSIMPVLPPAREAKITSVGPEGESILYMRNSQSGLSLWRQDVTSGTSKLLFVANTFLRGVAKAHLVHFQYVSLDGKELNAWLLLPLGYSVGRRYPLITYFYPTDDYSAREIPPAIRGYTALSSDTELNMEIAAAHGYAILFPSVPVGYQSRSEVRLKVVNEVLPAVAAAVRRGFADPRRLAVWGASYGGEAVFGLISRTNLFKAAIASYGLSDLISAYGTLGMSCRYDTRYRDAGRLELYIERGENNLGGPPWRHWFRYIENSPIFSVDRVHTPLLITQGDMDFVPIQQGEEFFRALVRQHKPVRFVRYWGESHGLSSPANVRDYWQQIFKWLKRYIPSTGP